MTEENSERNPVEKLAEEFLEQFRRGARPSLAEYIARHSEYADEIRELFPVLLDLEHAVPDTEGTVAPNDPVPIPMELGDYRVVREIGRGGMGIVYEAIHQTLGRSVALKVLPRRSDEDDVALKRFRREARVAAKLHHTNIVPVFEVGQAGSTSYYAMQYIQGQSFDVVIRDLRARLLPPKDSGHRGNLPAWLGRAVTRAWSPITPPERKTTAPIASSRKTPWAKDDGQPPGAAPLSFQQNDIAASGKGPQEDHGMCRENQGQGAPGIQTVMSEIDSHPSVIEAGFSDLRSYARSVAVIGSQVSQALAYAHARGVIHRDIKPSNLLLDKNGVVWVTDFGMAKIEADPLTRTGDILGTLHYMAPERFQGHCDERADIYALGLTLYELLTLKSAFEASDRLRLVEMISNQDPPRPRVVNPAIPRDLETIVLKAIEKEPSRRYKSAEQMSDDFQCFLEDRPILTRRVGTVEHVVRWARRNPLLSGLASTILLLLVLAAVGATIAAVRLKRSNDRAIAAQKTARKNLLQSEANAEQLFQESYINRVNLAYFEWNSDNVARAREYLENCSLNMRGWEWDYVDGLCRSALRSSREEGHSVNCLDISPDGKWIAIGTGNFLNRHGPPGDLIVRDLWTGDIKFAQRNLANGVTATAFSPDGTLIASANGQTLRLWDVETGEERVAKDGVSHDLLCLAFSPDGRSVAGGFGRFNGDHAGYVQIWDAVTGETRGDLIQGRSGGVWDVAFDPTGRRLAMTAADVVDVVDLETRERAASFKADIGFIYSVAYHPEGRYIAAAGLDRAIRLWDLETGELVRTYKGHTGFVRGLAFSRDGRRIISASEDKSLRLWDVESERALATYHGHTHFVNCVAFGQRGDVIASGSLDQTVKIWFASAERQLVYEGHREEGHVRALAFSPTGNMIASGALRFPGPTGRLHLWNSDTGEVVTQFPQNVPEVSSVAFRRDGNQLAAGHASGAVTVWEPKTARLLFQLESHVTEVTDIAYSPDGTLLASVGLDGAINLWNANDGSLAKTVLGHHAPITSVDFRPDGHVLATSSEDGTVKLWERQTLRELQTLRHDGGVVHGIVFSPDGRRLVSTGGIDHRRGDVMVWDVVKGQQIGRLPGHTDIVYDAAFSPDGKRFATASDDRTIKLWDVATLRDVFTIRGHTGGVVAVEFGPDGRKIASGGVDRTARVWSLTPPDADVYRRREAVVDYQAARTFLKKHQWTEATAALNRAIDRGLRNPQVYFDLGIALRHQDQDQSELLGDALQHVANDSRELAALALELEHHGRPGLAQQAAELAARRGQDDWCLSAAGRVFSVAGDQTRARDCFERAHQLIDVARGASKGPWFWTTGWWWTELTESELMGPDQRGLKESPFERLGMLRELTPMSSEDNVTWHVVHAEGDGFVDLRQPFLPSEPASHYAVQHVFSSTTQDVAFLMGADDDYQVWLNSDPIFRQTGGSSARVAQTAVTATLQPGWNTVSLQLVNRAGMHGVFFDISQHARDRARGYQRLRQMDQVIDTWKTASAAEQGDPLLISMAGHALARRGRWEDSAIVFRQLVERQPARNRNWFTLAPLLVYTGRIDEYHRLRKDILTNFGRTDDVLSAERTSKACLLMPMSHDEAQAALQLALFAAEEGADHNLAPYFLFAKGMAEYRVDDHQAAVASLQQALDQNRSRWPYLDVVVHMVLAMSHHGLTHQELAARHLREGQAIFEQDLPGADSDNFGADWLDWLICEIARREATNLISP